MCQDSHVTSVLNFVNRWNATEVKPTGMYWKKKRKTIAQSKTHEFWILISLVIFYHEEQTEKKYALISNEKVQLIAKLSYIPCPRVPGQVMKLTQGFQFNLFIFHSLSVNSRITRERVQLAEWLISSNSDICCPFTTHTRLLHNVISEARNHFAPMQVMQSSLYYGEIEMTHFFLEDMLGFSPSQ